MVKLWSEINEDVREKLRPDLGFRNWDDLDEIEKKNMWNHLGLQYYEGPVEECVDWLNEEYKYKNLTPQYLAVKGGSDDYLDDVIYERASNDFRSIFMLEPEDIVMEALSVFAKILYRHKVVALEAEKAEKEVGTVTYGFDVFMEKINDVFLQFGVKYYLTENGFVPRQDEKIVKEIYEPVLSYLSDKKWKKVNDNLSDAFADYRKSTPQGYSGCVTKTISAVQAFLQILVSGGTGKGDISTLIKSAIDKKLIPDDIFTKTVFKNIETIFARERQDTGDAHPKNEYASEKNARTVLNLAMIFIQHCMQK